MKLFVTGATGYLAYHLVNEAITQGHEVLCLRRPTSVSLFESPIAEQVAWVNNNDEACLQSTVQAFQPDILFHAAWGGVRGEGRNNDTIQKENIEMSRRLYSFYPYKQIIGLGSQAEYGYYEGLADENQEAKPLNRYGEAKIQAMLDMRAYCETHGIEWQWIRIFTVFGEKLTGGLIKLISERCLAGDKNFDTTKGEQKYSYLYAADFARAICKVFGAEGKSGVYNLSQPLEIHSNRDILQRVKALLQSDIHLNFGALPYPPKQVMYMDGCVTKFENAFGAIPHTDFDEALEKTVESVKRHL